MRLLTNETKKWFFYKLPNLLFVGYLFLGNKVTINSRVSVTSLVVVIILYCQL
jgi:hypothetical protein